MSHVGYSQYYGFVEGVLNVEHSTVKIIPVGHFGDYPSIGRKHISKNNNSI